MLRGAYLVAVHESDLELTHLHHFRLWEIRVLVEVASHQMEVWG
jgi:hypothetical protein